MASILQAGLPPERSMDLEFLLFIHVAYGVDLKLAKGGPMINPRFLYCDTMGDVAFRYLLRLASNGSYATVAQALSATSLKVGS
jgi:hypothetical protein